MAGQNNFLPGSSDSLYTYFTANEECERGFYSNLYEPYPGSNSGYWQQEQMAFARESSVTRMEQSPSIANKEASKSSATRNPKEKKKYETWSQDEQKLLVQLWATMLCCFVETETQDSTKTRKP